MLTTHDLQELVADYHGADPQQESSGSDSDDWGLTDRERASYAPEALQGDLKDEACQASAQIWAGGMLVISLNTMSGCKAYTTSHHYNLTAVE